MGSSFEGWNFFWRAHVYKFSYSDVVCSEHFTEDNYRVPGGTNHTPFWYSPTFRRKAPDVL